MTDDRPTLTVEISFTPTPSYPDNWIDVSDYVLLDRGVAIDRGRADEFEAFQAGTATITLNNADRRFDPSYASSPYYPNVRPYQKIRISGTWNGTPFAQIVGYIPAWRPKRGLDGLDTVELSVVDGLGSAFAQAALAESLTIGSMVTTTFSPVSIFAPSPSTPNQNGLPMSGIYIYETGDGAVTGGTYRISYNGTWTPFMAASTPAGQVCLTIEALTGMQSYSVFVRSYEASLSSAQQITFYLGGPFIGKDMSTAGLFTVDVSNLTGDGTGRAYQILPPAIPYVPGVMGKVGGRSIRATMSPTSAFTAPSFSRYFWAVGVAPQSRSIISQYATFNSTSNPVTLSTVFAQVFNIYSTTASFDTNDAGKTITAAYLNTSIVGQASGSMAYNAAAYGGWKPEDTRFDTGLSTLQALTIVGESPASILQAIADSEGGLAFISRDGYLTFRDRSTSNASSATFGVTGGDLPYEDATLLYDDRYIRNNVTVTRTGGTAQTIQDAASIERYYIRTLELSNLLIATDSEAQSRAQYLAARYREPKTRISPIMLRGELDPTTLWPILLDADIGDRFTINYPTTVGGATASYAVRLEAVRWRISTTAWELEWALSPVEPTFTLDDSLLDGDDTLLY